MTTRHLLDDTDASPHFSGQTNDAATLLDSQDAIPQNATSEVQDLLTESSPNGQFHVDDTNVHVASHGNPFRSGGPNDSQPASPKSPKSPKLSHSFTFNKRRAVPQPNQLRVDVPTEVMVGAPSFNRLNRNADSYDPHTVEFALESIGRRVAYGNFSTIDWIHDSAKERVRLRKLAAIPGWKGVVLRAWDASQAWILVFLVGAVSGVLAAWIDVAGEWLSDLKTGYCSEGFYLNRLFCCWHVPVGDTCNQWIPWSAAIGATGFGASTASFFLYVFWAVLFAVSAAVLVKEYAPYAAGSGLAEVRTILGGFVIRKFLGVWTLVIKCIGLALSTASGLSLGKEGPLVHVACCVGNVFARLFPKYSKNEAKKREILSAAAAAGVSVAFGAPIGGVLFSLEEVSYYFPMKTLWRSFLCAMMGAIALQLMNPFRTGKLVMFQVTYNRDWHAFELPWFVLLGVMGGLYGAFFIKANVRWVAFRKNGWLKNYQVQEVFVVSLITAIVGYSIIFLRVNMGELLANLFRECEEMENDFHGVCQKDKWARTVFMLLLSFVVKIILTIFTFGIRVPAGIFVPSMAIGATFGRALGIIVQHWQETYPHLWIFSGCPPDSQCVTPGTYAMVGAAAALGGVTRMTVCLTVIMFEVTGALSYGTLTNCLLIA